MSCYSLDLRKRVIKYIKDGNSVKKTSKIFGISIRTIFNWKKLSKLSNLEPKNNKIRKPQKINPESLKLYIETNPEQTLEQIAKYFKTSIPAIFYRIKELNFVYKKKNFSIKKEMKKGEKNI